MLFGFYQLHPVEHETHLKHIIKKWQKTPQNIRLEKSLKSSLWHWNLKNSLSLDWHNAIELTMLAWELKVFCYTKTWYLSGMA